ncbi:unnamed protein product [Staurois parvus]|uniref:PAS domain-containing protein n=1 Tax=Staurois parvus TaxID=386267 RepID=A0ABN9B255_9NEOB|nr:unnamed protein product [Staurois parvus]
MPSPPPELPERPPTLDAAGSAPRPPGPGPLLKLGERLVFNMERLWEQRRLSNASSNIERLLGLQHEALLGLVTTVRDQTTALQDLSHDIRALCQAGAEQNAPWPEAPNPCAVVVWGQCQVATEFPCRKVESAGKSEGEQPLEVPFWNDPLWSTPLKKPHPK